MWLETSPYDKLVLQRTLMEPLRQMLCEQFIMASSQWAKEQESALAEAIASGVAQPKRQYRVTIAALGTLEERFIQQVGVLWVVADMWSLVPSASWTVRFRSLAFRSLSRMLCAVHQLLVSKHKSFPVRLFALLDSPHLAAEMAATSACMFDAWTQSMLDAHPTLTGELCMSKLALAAYLIWTDISPIEARRATIRRILVAASIQTHVQSVEDLAARWHFVQQRTRRPEFCRSASTQQKRHMFAAARAEKRKHLQTRVSKVKVPTNEG